MARPTLDISIMRRGAMVLALVWSSIACGGSSEQNLGRPRRRPAVCAHEGLWRHVSAVVEGCSLPHASPAPFDEIYLSCESAVEAYPVVPNNGVGSPLGSAPVFVYCSSPLLRTTRRPHVLVGMAAMEGFVFVATDDGSIEVISPNSNGPMMCMRHLYRRCTTRECVRSAREYSDHAEHAAPCPQEGSRQESERGTNPQRSSRSRGHAAMGSSDGGVAVVSFATRASMRKPMTSRSCFRSVSTAESIRSMKRLPRSLCVPNDNLRQPSRSDPGSR